MLLLDMRKQRNGGDSPTGEGCAQDVHLIRPTRWPREQWEDCLEANRVPQEGDVQPGEGDCNTPWANDVRRRPSVHAMTEPLSQHWSQQVVGLYGVGEVEVR
jgi:hypothetical protein